MQCVYTSVCLYQYCDVETKISGIESIRVHGLLFLIGRDSWAASVGLALDAKVLARCFKTKTKTWFDSTRFLTARFHLDRRRTSIYLCLRPQHRDRMGDRLRALCNQPSRSSHLIGYPFVGRNNEYKRKLNVTYYPLGGLAAYTSMWLRAIQTEISVTRRLIWFGKKFTIYTELCTSEVRFCFHKTNTNKMCVLKCYHLCQY